ncbi:MAG: hypothetical protein ABI921_08815 [Panacibacter sp.]
MKMRKFGFFICCILLIAFTGCYYDKADLAYPKPPACDTTNVRLSVELQSIMEENCFSCHGGTAELGAYIQLEDYATIKDYADFGLLLSSLTQDGTTSAMPKGAAKLSDCDINKFDAWIKKGAPQN